MLFRGRIAEMELYSASKWEKRDQLGVGSLSGIPSTVPRSANHAIQTLPWTTSADPLVQIDLHHHDQSRRYLVELVSRLGASYWGTCHEENEDAFERRDLRDWHMRPVRLIV